MSSFRILLLSAVRPSRAWRFANRLLREVPGAELCGLLQQPIDDLSPSQQTIARGFTRWVEARGLFGRVQQGAQRLFEEAADAVLWLAHGCPTLPKAWTEFTPQVLAEHCASARWAYSLVSEPLGAACADFAAEQAPDLIVVLGEFPLSPSMAGAAPRGVIRISERSLKPNGRSGKARVLAVEHLAAASSPTFTMVTLTVPQMPGEGALGFTLKTDLIADDLLLRAAAAIHLPDRARAAHELQKWTQRLLTPYVKQIADCAVSPPARPAGVQRSRSLWKLCLYTLMLCSPLTAARNLYRRIVKRYPVLILAQHLVSDRPHRMGVSTEEFWRQVRFLQRHYRLVPLAQAVRLLRSGKVTVPTLALTFDDGYGENFVNLRAVADELDVPLALFVATAPVESGKEFEHDVTKGTSGFFPLTWDQIRHWRRRDVEFGSHTRSHFDCGSGDRQRLEWEIVGSQQDLRERLNRPVFFSFPWGGEQNMSAEALELAAATYPHFLSCFGGENHPQAGFEPRHLLRKSSYPDLWELELELQSVFQGLSRLKSRFRPPRLTSGVLLDSPAQSESFAFSRASGTAQEGKGRYLEA